MVPLAGRLELNDVADGTEPVADHWCCRVDDPLHPIALAHLSAIGGLDDRKKIARADGRRPRAHDRLS
jgi:hypothetical protein